MGWVSPTGGTGDYWNDIVNVRDGDVDTYSEQDYGREETPWLEATVSALLCDKVRFNAGSVLGLVSYIYVEVYYESAYHQIYEGVFTSPSWHIWIEKDVVPGNPGQTKSVSKMRLKMIRNGWAIATVYEAAFNQVTHKYLIGKKK